MTPQHACDPCLRRAFLVARLAPRIAGLLDRPRPRVHGLLALPEPQLVAAVAGERASALEVELGGFDAEAERSRLAAAEVAALCRHAPGYPALLRELEDPPAVLFGCGRVGALELLAEEPAVAIVGTRTPSGYGREVAYSLGRGLGASGVPVVSGLALGIDARAHRGCLEGKGVPLAVLACGPDVVYPRRHQRLYERVREAGLVLSELPPGTRPFRWSFPARNRIMAGLARLTLVVEAADPSGSLITADFARDLGRSVAAVPGPVTWRVARGTNGLLRDGATPVTGTEDVLDELYGVGSRVAGATVDGAADVCEPDDPVLARVLEAAERMSSVGAIAEATGLTTGAARAALARLEAGGYLVRSGLAGWERTLGPCERASGPRRRPLGPYPGGPVNAAGSRPPCVLSIAGSDSGGGAGIQADLKAFARCGVHGMTAITAVTAQNTVAVTGIYPLAPEAIVEQVRAVADDLGVDAVKIGMLGTVQTIEAVDRALDLVGDAPVVLDPVMVAESGARLLAEEAEQALRERLLPRVAVVTPNVPEARVLAMASAGNAARPGAAVVPGEGALPAGAEQPGEAERLARAVHALGPGAVVVTGGHREAATDLFFDGRRLVELSGERFEEGAAHGSGCTHSSALAANLALGCGPLEAARRAKAIAAEAVRNGLRGLGQGAGPVNVLGL